MTRQKIPAQSGEELEYAVETLPYKIVCTMRYEKREITAGEVATMLAVSERHAEALLKDRLIAGRQLRSGLWLTNTAAVERYRATAQRGTGRALGASTAWGLLWELSGRTPTWLSTSTLARVRQRIATSSPEDIVRATSGRTRVHFYTRGDGAPPVSWSPLIETGRPAARHLGVRYKRVFNYGAGYVRDGTISEFAERNQLFEDYEGKNLLFENTLPIAYERATMPTAVVAVDLAVGGSGYELEQGCRILMNLQSAWREAHDG